MRIPKTIERFIEEANRIHNFKYYYNMSEFINSKTKIEIICSAHGIFHQMHNSHTYAGQGCPKCGRERIIQKAIGRGCLTTAIFIERANKIHNFKYGYNLVEYVDDRTKVKIICFHHGIFLQEPVGHIHSKHGCPDCSRERLNLFAKTRRPSLEEFIARANKIHNFKYGYSKSEYINNKTKMEIECFIHGPFYQTPSNHTDNSRGCAKCGAEKSKQFCIEHRTLTTEQFIERARKIHGDRYGYSLSEYVDGKTPISIVCYTHGVFQLVAAYHLGNKRGCPECSKENRKGGKYTAEWFNAYPKKSQESAILYVVEMTRPNDHFYKVGITKNSVKERYQYNKSGEKYLKKNILIEKTLPLIEAYNLEQHILNTLKEYKYFPNYVFAGRTECLKATSEVLSQIQNIISSL